MRTEHHLLRLRLLLAATLVLSSCTLDIPYENQLSDPTAITSVTSAREFLASAYTRLPNPEFELSVLGDDFTPTPLISRNSDLSNLYKWQPQPLTDLARTLWQGYYETVALANALLERIPGVTVQDRDEQALLDAVVAEAKALKAYCYFDLLRLFAPDISEGDDRDGIILKHEFELGFLPRSSIAQCISHIRELLTESERVPNRPSASYWLSQQAVRCLLAEVELYAGRNREAATWARLVLTDSGGYPVFSEPNYTRLWSGETGPESLFSRHTTAAYYMGIRYDSEKGDYMEVSATLARSYAAEDLRGKESLYPRSFPGETVGETVTRRCMGKYNRMNWTSTEIRSIHKLRTATACFLLAEACCRMGGHDDEARAALTPYLTQRKGRPLDPSLTGDALLRAVLDEKHREFVGEGERYFDLKRYRTSLLSDWNRDLAEKRISATDYRWTLPIPQDEYFYNEHITQNAGWPMIGR